MTPFSDNPFNMLNNDFLENKKIIHDTRTFGKILGKSLPQICLRQYFDYQLSLQDL